jgi:beta-glucosidase-like glycosyl hydrolase
VVPTGIHWTFSPVLCLTRDLRWGRVGETFGEDPFLLGELGAALIRGYQGQGLDDANGILATAKHYAGYSETQGGRDASEADLSPRKLRSYFLPPFERAVQAGAMTFMTGYQSMEGVPSTANRWLLTEVLKDEWGFRGVLVTDWDNVGRLVREQKVCGSFAEAAAVAVRAGNDIMMTTPEFYEGALEAVRVRPFAHSYGLRGAGIGVWLEEGNQPKTTDPAIDASHLTILTPEATHSHPTATTSALQQTAPEAMVYYAHDPTGCYLPTEVTQSHNPPIYLGSHSWGYGENTSNYSTCDAAWDDYVYTSRIAMFLAAGNGSNYVMSPGKAYNVNAVGGSDHVNGGMYSGSSYINPETGAMKPDFVAPAVGLYIRAPDTFCPGCDSVTGTSIATPIAAGFAADMLSGSAFFRNQPQALKAAMLAGATTNIEGAALYSSRDGAGQINFLHSYFYRTGSWWNGSNSSFFDASGYITTSATMTAGDRMRVAISWLTPGSYVAANNRPSMEMTLEVRRGSFVRTSTLTGETFQLVDFVAPESGSYTIRIRRTFNSGVGNVLLALSVGKVA